MVVGAASFLLQLMMMSRTRTPRGGTDIINDERSNPPPV
jgi:hypothetical protein